MPTLTARIRRGVARDVGLLVLGVFLGGLVLVTGRVARNDASGTATKALRAYQLSSCPSTMVGRVVVARKAQSQADYYTGVLAAASVKQDVKRAATKVQAESQGAADKLVSLLILCRPYVLRGQRLPDLDARWCVKAPRRRFLTDRRCRRYAPQS